MRCAYCIAVDSSDNALRSCIYVYTLLTIALHWFALQRHCTLLNSVAAATLCVNKIVRYEAIRTEMRDAG